MSVALKAILAGVAVLAFGSYGYQYIAKARRMPIYATVWHNSGANSDEDYKNKSDENATPSIGQEYGMYLVSVKESVSLTNAGVTFQIKTPPWWRWSYKNWHHQGAESEYFKDVTMAYSEDEDSSALNQTCAHVYKSKTKNDIATVSDTEDKAALRRDLFLFCSPLQATPTRVQDNEFEDDTVGYKYREKLSSTDPSLNAIFWRIKEEWFFSNRLQENDVTEPLFKAFKKDTASKSTLREICAQSYAQTATKGKEKEETVPALKYCSFLPPKKTKAAVTQ